MLRAFQDSDVGDQGRGEVGRKWQDRLLGWMVSDLLFLWLLVVDGSSRGWIQGGLRSLTKRSLKGLPRE